MGTCTYLLSALCNASSELPTFWVEATNEHRGANTQVSYLKSVAVQVYQTRVVLLKGRRATVSPRQRVAISSRSEGKRGGGAMKQVDREEQNLFSLAHLTWLASAAGTEAQPTEMAPQATESRAAQKASYFRLKPHTRGLHVTATGCGTSQTLVQIGSSFEREGDRRTGRGKLCPWLLYLMAGQSLCLQKYQLQGSGGDSNHATRGGGGGGRTPAFLPWQHVVGHCGIEKAGLDWGPYVWLPASCGLEGIKELLSTCMGCIYGGAMLCSALSGLFPPAQSPSPGSLASLLGHPSLSSGRCCRWMGAASHCRCLWLMGESWCTSVARLLWSRQILV